MLESVDTMINSWATSTFITLSNIGIGLIIIPISVGIPCTLSLGNKVILELITNKYKNTKTKNRMIDKQMIILINYIENPFKIF